ncbi:MAG: nuclear transport factor 2 family protein [Pseudomonadota bacterium]
MKKGIAGVVMCLLTAVPVHAVELKDHLLASDKALWSAWDKKNGQLYKKAFAADAMYIVAGAVPIQGRDVIANEVTNNICTREKFAIENVSLRQLAPTVVELSYDALQTGECDGTPMPVKVRATSIYVRQGTLWLVALFQETPVELE